MNQDSPAKIQPRMRERMRLAVHESLLEAAERAVVQEGVEGRSLQSIARRAGVAVGTIYNYFADRQELVRELFSKRRDELLHAIDAGMKRGTFELELEAFARAFLAHYDKRRDFMRVVF